MYVTFPDTTGESTEIYRVSINGANLSFDAKGIVPGYVLNQYSMDEYNGYFRIATTSFNRFMGKQRPTQQPIRLKHES